MKTHLAHTKKVLALLGIFGFLMFTPVAAFAVTGGETPAAGGTPTTSTGGETPATGTTPTSNTNNGGGEAPSPGTGGGTGGGETPSQNQASSGSSADCTTSDGKPGVRTTISFNGSNCIAIGGGDQNTNIVFVVLKIILAFLGGGVGLAVVGGITWGSVMYMTARGDAGQVKKAETIIRDAIIGLLLFLGMAAVLNFLIPGGILG